MFSFPNTLTNGQPPLQCRLHARPDCVNTSLERNFHFVRSNCRGRTNTGHKAQSSHTADNIHNALYGRHSSRLHIWPCSVVTSIRCAYNFTCDWIPMCMSLYVCELAQVLAQQRRHNDNGRQRRSKDIKEIINIIKLGKLLWQIHGRGGGWRCCMIHAPVCVVYGPFPRTTVARESYSFAIDKDCVLCNIWLVRVACNECVRYVGAY